MKNKTVEANTFYMANDALNKYTYSIGNVKDVEAMFKSFCTSAAILANTMGGHIDFTCISQDEIIINYTNAGAVQRRHLIASQTKPL
jgi:sporulation protein YlmC with PRC-barrel domain